MLDSCFVISIGLKRRVISKKQDDTKFRVKTKLYFTNAKSPQETEKKFDKPYGESATSVSMAVSDLNIFELDKRA